jgi:hypothetical protein
LPGLGEGDRKLVAYYAIYPNILLSLHPDYMRAHSLGPRPRTRRKSRASGTFTRTESQSRSLWPAMRSSSGTVPIVRIGRFRAFPTRNPVSGVHTWAVF